MDLKQIKLIVLDLDGTLLDGRGEIGSESFRLIKELRERGVEFIIASGRLYSSITPHAEELELNNYIVALDGALIKHFGDKHTIHQAHIPAAKVEKAIGLADIHMTRQILCGDDHIFFTDSNSVVRDSLDRFGAEYKEVSSYYKVTHEILEIVFLSEKKENLKEIQSKLEFPRTFGLTNNLTHSSSDKGMYYLEVRKKGSTKAKGVRKVISKLGYKMSEVAVTGDWYNDVELFNMGAFTAAPSNAVPEIANNAAFLATRPNTEDGMAEFFDKLLKHK